MTKSELNSLSEIMALNVHLATTELLFDGIFLGEFPDEVRDGVADYERRTKDLNERLRNHIAARLEPLLTEED